MKYKMPLKCNSKIANPVGRSMVRLFLAHSVLRIRSEFIENEKPQPHVSNSILLGTPTSKQPFGKIDLTPNCKKSPTESSHIHI